MKIADVVQVKTHYTRSVNLERDTNSTSVVENYIPTSRALRTIERVLEQLHNDVAPRAWSLVGPYGSGKSSFALFLAKLLENNDEPQSKAALKVLRKSNRGLASKVKKHGKYLNVLVTGSPEPLARRLTSAILDSAENFYAGRKGKNPKALDSFQQLLLSDEISVNEFLIALNTLNAALEQSGVAGLILMIDELGKFLEYEARHYGANDIFLLQALAEHACAEGSFKFLLFAFLHQSFEQYAKGLGESLRNEWGKIQGRFEEIPFLESSEQVLKVVGAAFEAEKNKVDVVNRKVAPVTKKMGKLSLLPGVMNLDEATALFAGCYPLHPITALILPTLCQKIAQNERTLFSYIGSREEFGIASLMRSLDFGEFVMPHHVFDYFVTNQSNVVGDYMIHRRWVEVLTAIERLGDAAPEEVELLKAIGLLNIVGVKGELKPSSDLLTLVTNASKTQFTSTISSLMNKSILTFRKFNSEYRVWQGSDFDLETALAEERANLGNFSLAEQLNQSDQLTPVVARKYSIQTGALRYFQPMFVDARSYKLEPNKSDDPRIIFFLAFGEDDKQFLPSVTKHFSELDLIVLCATSEKLSEAVAETIALRKVLVSSSALNSDPVAQREFDDRMFSSELVEQSMLREYLEQPQMHRWFHGDTELKIESKRELQSRLSDVLGLVYSKTPLVYNELVNRDRPSTQANAARNKLLFGMQEKAHLPDLGIEKFPAEKAIYRAALKETGIHGPQDDELGDWEFRAPTKNASRISFVWERIEDFLELTEKEPRSFVELNKELMAPPYGVKAGLLPILYFSVYQVYQSELALYENRRYRPRFSPEMIERFTKRPDDFTVQRFRIDGMRASIFAQYSKVIHGDSEPRTLLELAKPLAAFMGGLPEYTKKTRRGLSERAQKVRTAFNLSKSPEKLLFSELPNALGYSALDGAKQSDLEDYSESLIGILRELRDAHDVLVAKQKGSLAQLFNRDPAISLEELMQVSKQWSGLESYTLDTKGLSAFLSRLTRIDSDPTSWFENILMFLGHKPSKKWLDSDQDTAEYRLNDFAHRIIDLERIRMLEKQKSIGLDGDIDFYLLKSVKKGAETKDEVIAIDDKTAARIRPVEEKLGLLLDELDNDALKLAALTKFVDGFLTNIAKKEEPNLKVVGGKEDE